MLLPAGLVGAAILAAGSPLTMNAAAVTSKPASKARAAAAAQTCAPSPRPPFFADEVQQPPAAATDRPHHYTFTAAVHHTHRFASSWPPVKTLAYSTANAPMDYLGPTLVTRQGHPVDVKLVNDLPPAGTPIFPFGQPDNRNTLNLHHHGGLQPVSSDGVPAPLGTEVPPGGSYTYHYPNYQAAAPLFYHDHTDMTTGYHTYPGLVGFSPQTDERERSFGLPSGRFEKLYELQDKSFDPVTKELCYSGSFGDLPVVNGTIAPKQQVEPRRYLFTLLNSSGQRFYHLSLKQVAGEPGSAPPITVVASDDGYLRHPVRVRELLIAPGERYRVVVDFHGHRSQQWVLSNDANAPYPGPNTAALIPQLMRFDVDKRLSRPDHSRIPDTIDETNNTEPLVRKVQDARLRTVQAGPKEKDAPELGDANRLLNYLDPPTETPQVGSWEVWAMRNWGGNSHPIHLHLLEMQLIGRWHVGRWDADKKPVPSTIGPFEPAPAYESGPKDVFIADPNYITAWVGKFTIAGTAVWHCHIIPHEDGVMTNGRIEMMRPLVIGHTPQRQLPLVESLKRLDRLVRRP
ncbi:multicopper oxidase family protein [Streptomyces soliscabiei]|uniref:multicopper oxidase family protein n=1 Tax=Streptomyces soliscabiei TaxID=588897 RepID=UPI0029B3A9A8|nr:multicopper oxidase domain-containing protein [Streptomyces sp. NY05-11A]MDX2683210.1 multicopper oxidase domain-containing protein [Streptomyces sp. NY05-11A]